MSSHNLITLVGNVGKAPEIRTVGSGKVANFSLATSRQWKDKSGQKQEKTEWHRLVAWNAGQTGLADIVERYVQKGDKVLVVGALEYREWEKDGVTRTSAEIRVTDLRLLGGKKGDHEPGDREPAAPRDVSAVLADEEDDLPF